MIAKRVSKLDPTPGLNKFTLNLFDHETMRRAKHGQDLIRGRIELRRIFNEDQFILAITITTPNWSKHRGGLSYNLNNAVITVNNKVLDNNVLKIAKGNYEIGLKGNKLDSLLDYSLSSFVTKPTDSIDIYNIVIKSQDLGLKFSELNSVIFQDSYTKDVLEVKKIATTNRKYFLLASDDKAIISIPDKYQFDFGELHNDVLSVSKRYLNTEITFNKLNYLHQNKIASAKIYVEDDRRKLQKAMFPLEGFYPYYLNKNYQYSFTKNQSLSKHGIVEISGKHLANVNNKTNIREQIQSSIYSNGIEKSEYIFEEPIEYDFQTNVLVNGEDYSKKGLFVPYNFKGDLNTIYNYQFKNSNAAKDIFDISINHMQKVANRILDPYDGEVKMKINNTFFENKELKYQMNQDEVDKFLKSSTQDINYFETYKKVIDEKKDSN
ncbi:MHO_1580 family protein [Mycoplasma simbae]|uniref:MHO_1580 family protein n=1 Tax=Mycoplasma simbae TaxID=36744 RepID=UPI00049819E4|nr:hypothetical protein [Mycoplasma simbae]